MDNLNIRRSHTTRGTNSADSDTPLDDPLPKSEAPEVAKTVASPVDVKSVDQGKRGFSKNDLLNGRYQVVSVLGEGGYGLVVKAFDRQLQRHVAIKIPNRLTDASERIVKQCLEEARTLAKLEHPRIVAVHDVFVTPDGLPCIVSAFIPGITLGRRMQTKPLTLRRGLKVLIEMGRALAYVHSLGIVHRDVKPSNILLNETGEPFLADFGLALRDEAIRESGRWVGTPGYMSPEQARGESHLVDGRSDIFSLGVILFEMLTGKRPFGSRDRTAIFDRLLNQDTCPPRQLNPNIPRELERVCLKSLAKRALNRYASAADFVEDIEHFLSQQDSPAAVLIGDLTNQDQAISSPQMKTPSLGGRSLIVDPVSGIIPRGLQSYDKHDKDFFCRLLPGPHDRDWIPESIRFWQRRIEAIDAQDPLRIGVIYGPSGCGKSSFVKAGLLPLLTSDVEHVFIEATREETELRILARLEKRFPDLRNSQEFTVADLPHLIRQIRAECEDQGRRLLIVIDQFEQWLHSKYDVSGDSLIGALRQCDGIHIQCLLLVRDDFWLALSRLMDQLEAPIRQNVNAMLVDLFDNQHARKVLYDLGVAYHRLPDEPHTLSLEQNAFLDRAVEGLSEAGKVFPIRLSLFVEMVKSKNWTAATLEQMGGVSGMGVTFLKESFSNELAPIAQRSHETAARKVLRSLLPETGVDIKGRMRSEHELLELSEYQDQRKSFNALMHILEIDLRLISPTDPSGTDSSTESQSGTAPGIVFYQLTHDFLVPAIDQWVTERQRETRRGRVELRIAEYASLWSNKRTNKFLPTWLDWVSIFAWTYSSTWNDTERQMMKSATKYHLTRTLLLVGTLFAICFAGWTYRRRSEVNATIAQLQSARIDQLSPILDALAGYRTDTLRVISSKLNERDSEPNSHADDPVNWRYLLLQAELDPSTRDAFVQDHLNLSPPAIELVADRLGPFSDDLIDELSRLLSEKVKKENDSKQFLSTAILLSSTSATSDTARESLATHSVSVAESLVQHALTAPQDNQVLIRSFAKSIDQIMPGMQWTATEHSDSTARSLANSLGIQLLAPHPSRLFQFYLNARWEQHAQILAVLGPNLEEITAEVYREANKPLNTSLAEKEFDKASRRKALAGALLHRQGQPQSTWEFLKLSPRPNLRGYLIDRIALSGGELDVLSNRYQREADVSVRRALLTIMGTFDVSKNNEHSQQTVVDLIKDAFLHDPDAGVHSAAQWVLLKWGHNDWLVETTNSMRGKPKPDRSNWYVDPEGHTMVVLDARDVPGINRVFAIAIGEVTTEQFLRHDPDHRNYKNRSPTPDCPAGNINWLNAAGYCNWINNELGIENPNPYPVKPESLDSDFREMLKTDVYRLPTYDEWYYAAMALTETKFNWGSSKEIADEYLFYYEIATDEKGMVRYHPAGTKRPNDFGLFQVYDGVREWCHNGSDKRRIVAGLTSSVDLTIIGFAGQRPNSAQVSLDLIESQNGFYGLRVARTVLDNGSP